MEWDTVAIMHANRQTGRKDRQIDRETDRQARQTGQRGKEVDRWPWTDETGGRSLLMRRTSKIEKVQNNNVVFNRTRLRIRNLQTGKDGGQK